LGLLPLLLGGCATLHPPTASVRAPAGPPPLQRAAALERIFSASANTTGSAYRESVVARAKITTLTLDGVQAIALREHPTFKEFAASRALARAEVLQALAYPNPELEASLGFVTTREAPVESAWESGLGLFQVLEWPAKRKARRRAAEAQEPIIQRDEDLFRATLRADVAKAYYTVLYYQHGVRLAEAAFGTEREIERIVRRRFDAGEAPQIDLTQTRVETLKAQRTVQAQRRQLATAQAVLRALAGRALPPEFALADTLDQPLPGANFHEAYQIALAQHPTLRRLEAVLHQRELVIGRERTAWYPDLKVGLSPSQEIDTRGIGASVGMELPLWNRNQGGIAAAQAELQQAQAGVEQARQEVLRDLETDMQSYESAREQLAAFAGGLRAAATETLHIATFLYEEGDADLLHLLDARRTARQTEAEYLQAQYDAQIARADLEWAIGIGGEE
jgi:cobalt-zinc-cadmium efflux system outer membrane protein